MTAVAVVGTRELLNAMPLRALGAIAAVGLLLLNAIIGRALRNYQIAPPRYFFLVAIGWAFTLGFYASDGARVSDVIGVSGETVLLITRIMSAGVVTCFLGASRWQVAAARRLLPRRGHILALFAALTILIIAATTIKPEAHIVDASLAFLEAGAIGLLAYAYRETFRSTPGGYPANVKLLMVLPLAAYALLQLATIPATMAGTPLGSGEFHAAVFGGIVCTWLHLGGVLEYAAYAFSAFERKVQAADPAFIRRLAEQLSHELETPALDLRLRAEAITEHGSEDPDVAAAQRAVEQIVGATASFQEYLDEHGPSDARPRTRISLNTACDQAIVTIKTTLSNSRDVVFRREYHGGLFVEVTASELQQILRNLLKNAVEAVRAALPERGSGVVQVTTCLVSVGERDFVEVSIADSGPGVPQTLTESIFADGFSTKAGIGRGHGLHIAARLAARQEGALVLATAPSTTLSGAEFVLRLPAAPSRAPTGAGKRNHGN